MSAHNFLRKSRNTHSFKNVCAVRSLWEDDPFGAARGGGTSGKLVEVDVDDTSTIVFGGSGSYTGWIMGDDAAVSLVPGPGGYMNGISFSPGGFIKLGDSGVKVSGNFTVDFHVRCDQQLLSRRPAELGVLLASKNSELSISGTMMMPLMMPLMMNEWHGVTFHFFEEQRSIDLPIYQGCYADNTDGVRDLSGQGSAGSTALSSTSTAEALSQCSGECAGFEYMGLQVNPDSIRRR